MQYIASLSYGKDSIIIPELCRIHNLPLDRIVHVEIMATETIPADLPPMMAFKSDADRIIKERYGITVEHLHAPKSYSEYFYECRGARSRTKNGIMYGFPMLTGAWCNSRLKTGCLKKLANKNTVQYIGIAADEPNRFHNLTERKISPLVEYDVTEEAARKLAESLGLLSPIYSTATRGGCWFCHNQGLGQLRFLRDNYPEYWALLLKWDTDSPTTFKPDGTTVHDYEERFQNEDAQTRLF